MGNNRFSEDFANVRNEWSLMSFTPVDTGRKLNVHKTFRRCQNVLCTCNLRPVSTVTFNVFPIYVKEINKNEKIRPIKYPNGHMTYLEGT